MKKVQLSVVFVVIFMFYGQEKIMAQSFFHTRIGIGHGRFSPLDKEKLDVNEHEIYGAIIDFEYGKQFALNDRFSLLLGIRNSYGFRSVEGTYTIVTWTDEHAANTHSISLYLTPGLSMELSEKFSMLFQVNLGPTYVLWKGDVTHANLLFYVPLDLAAEYKLKNDLSFTFGINVQLPIYTSTQETIMLGLRKSF